MTTDHGERDADCTPSYGRDPPSRRSHGDMSITSHPVIERRSDIIVDFKANTGTESRTAWGVSGRDKARTTARQVDTGGRRQRRPPADEPEVQRSSSTEPDTGLDQQLWAPLLHYRRSWRGRMSQKCGVFHMITLLNSSEEILRNLRSIWRHRITQHFVCITNKFVRKLRRKSFESREQIMRRILCVLRRNLFVIQAKCFVIAKKRVRITTP